MGLLLPFLLWFCAVIPSYPFFPPVSFNFQAPENTGIYLRISGFPQPGEHLIEWRSLQWERSITVLFGWDKCDMDSVCCTFAAFDSNGTMFQTDVPLYCRNRVIDIAAWIDSVGTLNFHIDGYPVKIRLFYPSETLQRTDSESTIQIKPTTPHIVVHHVGIFTPNTPPLINFCGAQSYKCTEEPDTIRFVLLTSVNTTHCPKNWPIVPVISTAFEHRSKEDASSLASLDPYTCNARIHTVQGVQYYLSAPNLDSHAQATTYCVDGGAQLASLTEPKLLAELAAQISGPVSSLWAGVMWRGHDSTWGPTDGTPVVNVQIEQVGNPNNLTCVQWVNQDGGEFVFTPTVCKNIPGRVICRMIQEAHNYTFEVHFKEQPTFLMHWPQFKTTAVAIVPAAVSQPLAKEFSSMLRIPHHQMLQFLNHYVVASGEKGPTHVVVAMSIHPVFQAQLEMLSEPVPFEDLGERLCDCKAEVPLYGDIVTPPRNSAESECGDGKQLPDEECDDGNWLRNDGCSADCTVENGYACSTHIGGLSTCQVVCGDAKLLQLEQCDDGNSNDRDGCSSSCTVETGFECNNAQLPSICHPVVVGPGPSTIKLPSNEEKEEVEPNNNITVLAVIVIGISSAMLGVGLCVVVYCVWAWRKVKRNQVQLKGRPPLSFSDVQGNSLQSTNGNPSTVKAEPTESPNDRSVAGREQIVQLLGTDIKTVTLCTMTFSLNIRNVSEIQLESHERTSAVKSQFVGMNGYSIVVYDTLLGRGGNGEVFLGELQLDGRKTPVAVKLLEITDVGEIMQELMLMVKLRHPNVVCMYDVHVSKPKQGDERQKLYLVMELMGGGDLLTLRTKQLATCNTYLPMVTVQRIANDILQGLAYLHSKSVTHRDVKPQNVLVNDQGVTKLADFGASSIHVRTVQATTIKGTPKYLSPEAVDGQISHVADIWAFGLTMLDISCKDGGYERGKYPHPMQLLYQISTNQVRPHIPDNLPDTFKNMVSSCFLPADQRRSASQLLVHPFLTDTL